MLTEQQVLDYIKDRRYYCCFCADLQERVAKYGLEAVRKYDGMVCGGIEDMQIKVAEFDRNNRVGTSID